MTLRINVISHLKSWSQYPSKHINTASCWHHLYLLTFISLNVDTKDKGNIWSKPFYKCHICVASTLASIIFWWNSRGLHLAQWMYINCLFLLPVCQSTQPSVRMEHLLLFPFVNFFTEHFPECCIWLYLSDGLHMWAIEQNVWRWTTCPQKCTKVVKVLNERWLI